MREGAQVAIVGRPNSGKSSLFNRLAGAGRAIVTDIPGTTRDLVTEVIDIDGAAITLVDTAGLHGAPADAVEEEGIARARAAAARRRPGDRRARSIAADERRRSRAARARRRSRPRSSSRTSATCQPPGIRSMREFRRCRFPRQTARVSTISAGRSEHVCRQRSPARHAGGHEHAPRGPADEGPRGASACGTGRARGHDGRVRGGRSCRGARPAGRGDGRANAGRRARGNLQPVLHWKVK